MTSALACSPAEWSTGLGLADLGALIERTMLSNKELQQTKRVDGRPPSRPGVINVRFAAELQCHTDMLRAKEETMPSNRRVFLVGALAFGWGAVATGGVLTQQDKADYDSPPRPTKVTKPKYPPEALEKGIEGTVIVEMTIDAEGRVVDPSVAQSVEGLDEAALECVQEWRFKPATKDGEPVRATARAPVTFRLKDANKE